MGFLDRKRKKIIESYLSSLTITILSDRIAIPTRLYENKSGMFNIQARMLEIDHSVFEIKTDSYEQVTVLSAQLWIEPVHFNILPQSSKLFPNEDVKVLSVPFTEFPLTISRVSFQSIKRESGLLFSTFVKKAKFPVRIKKVKPAPRPPSFQTVSLEERLRWILTPPIHELLSDPQLCLPEKPFPFQTIGIKWLYDRDSALLADEMGLGKTMQAIIAGRLLWRSGIINQIFVICPKTLIPTWQIEIGKWWPQVTHNVMVAGSDRQFFLRLATPNATIKIINYAALAREAEWLEEQLFSHDLVIIDEAQRIKNPKTKTSRAVKALKSPRRWALTGTPLENKVEDLISIFDFVRPGLFYDDEEGLTRDYAPTFFWDDVEIKRMIRAYLLRRRMEEVMDELPDKSEQDIEIELEAVQRDTYDKMEEEGVVELNTKGDSITVTHVFALINKLRQICNFDPVTRASAKLERLIEDLEEVSDSGRKALVFSQFVEDVYGLKRLAKELQEQGLHVLQLHGQIPQNRRTAVIQTFHSDSDITALLLNFRVGGVGLNLQAANYVFLFDRWWNPAVEDQATSRVYRIGQTQKVFIRRFYCKDTIEERILKKLAEKRRLFRHIIDETRPQPDSLGLTEEEIFSLFNLKVRPRKKSEPSAPLPIILENTDPAQFEALVAELYDRQGYKVTLTAGSHDAGIDILAEKISAQARQRVVIQCKHQQANVGRPILQQLWGVVTSDPSFTRGDLVTSSGFTAQAKEFAQGKRLTLIDRASLENLTRQFKVAHFEQDPTG